MLRKKRVKNIKQVESLASQGEGGSPTVVEHKEERITFLYGVGVVALMLINMSIWGYFTYESVLFYHCECQHKITMAKRLPAAKVDALATVDGHPITQEDMQELMLDMPQVSELPMETVYPNLLNMLINNKVIMLQAKRHGVDRRPEIRRLLRQANEQIVGQTYLNELLEANVSEEELKALYEQELQNFQREEEVHARHILVKTEKEAKDLLVQLKAGANFAKLAEAKSLDKNAEGGDLGYFTKGMMVPEFGDAVFDLKKGQLSAPIHTAFGWHIAYVEDKRLADPPTFEEVKDQIKQAVMETKLQSVLSNERAKLNVKVLKPTLK
ncbi:MAG: peptidylprolyl isomerase [Alphaproteobacteria bacterium]|nr:peptidylprolyl isomerase [Alphaproteobacteria bacterium]